MVQLVYDKPHGWATKQRKNSTFCRVFLAANHHSLKSWWQSNHNSVLFLLSEVY